MLSIPLTEDAVKYLNTQRVLTKKLKHKDVEWYAYLLFHFIANQIKPYLTPGTRCLDIGSGLGLVNMFLHDIYEEIYCFDKTVPIDELENTYYGWHKNYCFYNNLQIAKQINPKITTTDTLDIFPNNHFDMIHSHMSWCWHYPEDTYYDIVVNLLKPNGILIVDICKDRQYNFKDFSCIDKLENREHDSWKLILKRNY